MSTKLLICDDSNMARKQLARSLPEDWDVDISFAADGVEGLEAIKAGKGDVLLLDLNMPNMDGISFLREKAGRDGIKDIPVLMISTETGDDIIGAAKSIGAIGAIKKPFTPDKVNEVLGPLL